MVQIFYSFIYEKIYIYTVYFGHTWINITWLECIYCYYNELFSAASVTSLENDSWYWLVGPKIKINLCFVQ